MSLATRSMLVLVVTLMPAITASATAQTVATSYEELRRILTRGQKVVVIDPAGETVRGRVTEVSPDAFVLTTGDWRAGAPDQLRHTFTEGPLTARQRNDKLTNGLLIGLAVGAVAGGFALSQECYRNGNDCTDYGGAGGMFIIGAGFFGGIGAGVGTLVDLATPHKELVVTYRWQPSRARTLKVGPRLDRASLGVAATLGF